MTELENPGFSILYLPPDLMYLHSHCQGPPNGCDHLAFLLKTLQLSIFFPADKKIHHVSLHT